MFVLDESFLNRAEIVTVFGSGDQYQSYLRENGQDQDQYDIRSYEWQYAFKNGTGGLTGRVGNNKTAHCLIFWSNGPTSKNLI